MTQARIVRSFSVFALALAVGASAAMSIVSHAQDTGEAKEGQVPAADAPAAETKAPEGPTDEQDAVAREALVKAADAQGGRGLVAPTGKLESFRLLLGKVTFEKEKVNEDGGKTTMTVEVDEDGLELFWMGDQIRTFWTIDGKRTQRGRFRRGEVVTPWLHDGTKTTLLAGEKYAKDIEQIERDQRIIRALLDVGILRTMLSDGSRWQVIEDTSYEGTAIHRTPPAGKDVHLKLTLWLDPKTHRISAARLWPNDADEAIMYYSFTYDETLPKVTGDTLKFPFQFNVYEQLNPAEAPRLVMAGAVRTVSFNALTADDMLPPKNR